MTDHGLEHHWPSNGDDLPAHVELPAEPRSPAWLGWLGIAVFAVLGLLWVWPSEPAAPTDAPATASSTP